MINIWEMGIMRIINLNQTPDSDWPQCDSTYMGNDFRNDSVPMCPEFLNQILKETQRSSFYILNKQDSTFKKWSQIWSLGPQGVLMSAYCPNLFVWDHLPPILLKKSLKDSTFKKWSQIRSPGTPFGAPPGTPRGLKFFGWAGNI